MPTFTSYYYTSHSSLQKHFVILAVCLMTSDDQNITSWVHFCLLHYFRLTHFGESGECRFVICENLQLVHPPRQSNHSSCIMQGWKILKSGENTS